MFNMSVDDWKQWMVVVLSDSTWGLHVFIVILLTFIATLLQKHFFKQLHKQLSKTRNPWDDAVVIAANKPLGWLIWLLGLNIAVGFINVETKAPVFELVDPATYVGVILLMLMFIIRLLQQIEINLIEQKNDDGTNKYDAATVEALNKLLKVSAIITATLVILQTLGFSISGVLAFGGIGGIAVGFAAKDLLANFFGGLMIYLDRPFTVGDWIRSPDKSIEGTVEKIGWRLTCIRTFDKRPLYVPNSVFTSIAVENPSRMSNRRIYETIGIRYEDSQHMPAIINEVRTMLENHPEIDHQQTLIVNFNKFAESSLDFFIYTFTNTTNWVYFHKVKQDVLLKVLEIIENQGAEVAFPTSTLHIEELPEFTN